MIADYTSVEFVKPVVLRGEPVVSVGARGHTVDGIPGRPLGEPEDGYVVEVGPFGDHGEPTAVVTVGESWLKVVPR